MMDYTEQKITGKTVFQGKIIQVELDEITLPNGRPARREVVRHPGGVCILALDQDGQVTLVRQYRYPMAEHIIELPAGKLDPGEEPSAAARRELALAPRYDYLLVNSQVEQAARQLGEIIAAAKCVPARNRELLEHFLG